jgi:hypothetical protein
MRFMPLRSYAVAIRGFLASIFAAAMFASYGVPVEWRVEDGGNGHFYELVGNFLDVNDRYLWADAKVVAEGRTHQDVHGHLATITSDAENRFLIETFHNANPWPTWIGLTDNEAYGGSESFGQANPTVDGWVWVTGEPITFHGWVTGRPDNTNDEDYALIGSSWGIDSLWNDGQDSWHAAFFVEYDVAPVPDRTPFALTIACLALLAARRFTGERAPCSHSCAASRLQPHSRL